MPQDILPQRPIITQKIQKPKKTSGMSIFLAIVLGAVLISLGEYILFDLNRSVNPAYEECGRYSRPSYSISQGSTSPGEYDADDCRNFALLIHAAFIIPVFLIAFLIYFFFYYRKPDSKYKVLAWPYFVVSMVLMAHLLIETGVRFVGNKIAIYVILGVIAIILTALVILLQKKFTEKQAV